MERRTIRRMWRTLETIHGMVYFAPEGDEEYRGVGLDEGRMGYFASRSAPMGAVPAEVVIATFYNFHPELVRRVIPKAWTLASPEDVTAARRRVVDRSLQRMLGVDVAGRVDVLEACSLARVALEACEPPGRPLFAGHASLDWPEPTHVALWHAISLLREYRGDGHIASLVARGIGPLTALVLHGASGDVAPRTLRATREWPKDDWQRETERLTELGWLDREGELTEAGRAVRQDYEDATDDAARAPWEHLGEERGARLAELGKTLSREIIDAGAFTNAFSTR